MTEITARTKVLALLGHPVGHSVSPAMHNAALAALGLDWCYLAFDVAPDRLAEALSGARALGMKGLNLTIPHKEAALAQMTKVDPAARSIGAINTVCLEKEALVGYNTDKEGFLRAIAGARFSPAGKRAALLGAGGVARAVLVALAEADLRELSIADGVPERAETLAALAAELGLQSRALPWEEGRREMAGNSDLIVNATPLGMAPRTDETPLPGEWLRQGQFVCDLVFNPDPTRLMREARERGCPVLGGLDMLVHQGALSFQLWTGIEPPLPVMAAAARAALEGSADEAE